MMKKILTFLIFLVCCINSIDAQTFTVFSIQGSVDSLDRKGKPSSQIRYKQELDSATCIRVNENSKITFIHKQNHRLYTINKPVKGEIAKLIYQEECSIKNLSKQYLKYLLNRMAHNKQLRASYNYMGRTASSYRGDDPDSLMCDSTCMDSIWVDSTACKTLSDTSTGGELSQKTSK